MTVWDTSLASRLHPEDAHFDVVLSAAESGEPILVAAATVAEISHGLQRKAGEEGFIALLDWFTSLFRDEIIGVLPLTREAALLAGSLRAIHPDPPSIARGDKRPKPERRVAWIADIQIASTAWVVGEPVCTADRGHFEHLSSTIGSLFPREGALEILESP
jgi:predicted nucleic acid-binding protein